jgi:hypothetical protein
MSGAASRTKGHGFERIVARLWNGAFPGAEAARGLQYRNPSLCDVEGTQLRIECKRQKKVSYADVVRALNKAKEQAAQYHDDRPIVVVTKEDRGDILVSLELSTFLRIIETYYSEAGGGRNV